MPPPAPGAATTVAEPASAAKKPIPGEQQDEHDDDHGEDGDHAGRRSVASLAAQPRPFQIAHLLASTIRRCADIKLLLELSSFGSGSQGLERFSIQDQAGI